MNVYNLAGKKIFVAGHRGMLGSALVRRLASERCEIHTANRHELDLRRQSDVLSWMEKTKPQAVLLAAAKVGGIHANNTQPADFLYDNLAIQSNVVNAAYLTKVEKLLFVASSCIYPREAPQPLKEEYMLTGLPEPTNEWYAIAKISGIKLCQAYRRQFGCDFISAVPTNLYGEHDHFDPLLSHVVPGMILRAHEAKIGKAQEMRVWGTGKPRREFMHVDDAADVCVTLLKSYSDEMPVNVGTGEDISIKDLAQLVAEVVNYRGSIIFDSSKPDGMPVKRLDVSRLKAFDLKKPRGLREGLVETYKWFLTQQKSVA